ncbi:hypothetical protein SPBR_02100 [Sporothrix brasiliensis 5110]|uniref:Uncharacterized protein n=1 Tax=Sporothrix brasiliensis 5110 TaxID=1398154 RepID=A0A0C2FJI5_9PEZI|nr:uncharacterized protein SPBR_02100 [Sporothrix brasiliensis 5110]KIH91198.1 hypothetical protein SPBR_02100 [Sporothrix brasiliensis 5110]
MSCGHNTPSSSSATATAASFTQTPSRKQPCATSTSASTPPSFVAPPAAAGVVVPAEHAHDLDSEQPPTRAASITLAPAGAAEATEATTMKPCGKFVQTTYYSCVTLGTYSHCGWHEPILDASTSAATRVQLQWSWPALWTAAIVVAVCFVGQ